MGVGRVTRVAEGPAEGSVQVFNRQYHVQRVARTHAQPRRLSKPAGDGSKHAGSGKTTTAESMRTTTHTEKILSCQVETVISIEAPTPEPPSGSAR